MGIRDEILDQPAVAAGMLEAGLPVIEAIARAIQSRRIEFVVIAGRGTSDHAGVYAPFTSLGRGRPPGRIGGA